MASSSSSLKKETFISVLYLQSKIFNKCKEVIQRITIKFLKYINVSLSLWLPTCVTIFVWSHVTAKQSHVHYFSSVHMSSCSIAFKFGRIISYINVHAEVNFKSKNIYTSKAMVLFVLSAPKIRYYSGSQMKCN